MVITLVSVLLATAVSWWVTGRLIDYANRKGMLDEPNERSSHTRPTPRGGGLGVCAGLAAGVAVNAAGSEGLPLGLLTACAGVAALGYWDDRSRGVAARVRFPLQGLAAAVAVAALGPIGRLPLPAPLDVPLGMLAWPVTLFWILAVLNIYNFLDGIDGFAGLQGLLAGLGLAALPLPAPARLLGLAVAGACLGFLRWNWPPAKIFMGDVGSTLLGFVFATAPLLAPADERPAAVVSMALLMWCFLADGTFTIFRRLRRGDKIWEAHRSHLYQRLVIAGLTHATVSGRVGVMMTLVGAVAVWVAWVATPASAWLALAAALGGFLVYWNWVRVCEKRRAR